MVPFAKEIRRKILGEIYGILKTTVQQCAKQPQVMKSQFILQILYVFTSLHTFLLPIRDVAKMSLKTYIKNQQKQKKTQKGSSKDAKDSKEQQKEQQKEKEKEKNEKNKNKLKFLKVYIQAIKLITLDNYYQFEDLFKFFSDPLSILYQYSLSFGLNHDLHKQKDVQKNVQQNSLLKSQFMPLRILRNDKTFASDWQFMMNPTPNQDPHHNAQLQQNKHSNQSESSQQSFFLFPAGVTQIPVQQTNLNADNVQHPSSNAGEDQRHNLFRGLDQLMNRLHNGINNNNNNNNNRFMHHRRQQQVNRQWVSDEADQDEPQIFVDDENAGFLDQNINYDDEDDDDDEDDEGGQGVDEDNGENLHPDPDEEADHEPIEDHDDSEEDGGDEEEKDQEEQAINEYDVQAQNIESNLYGAANQGNQANYAVARRNNNHSNSSHSNSNSSMNQSSFLEGHSSHSLSSLDGGGGGNSMCLEDMDIEDGDQDQDHLQMDRDEGVYSHSNTSSLSDAFSSEYDILGSDMDDDHFQMDNEELNDLNIIDEEGHVNSNIQQLIQEEEHSLSSHSSSRSRPENNNLNEAVILNEGGGGLLLDDINLDNQNLNLNLQDTQQIQIQPQQVQAQQEQEDQAEHYQQQQFQQRTARIPFSRTNQAMQQQAYQQSCSWLSYLPEQQSILKVLAFDSMPMDSEMIRIGNNMHYHLRQLFIIPKKAKKDKNAVAVKEQKEKNKQLSNCMSVLQKVYTETDQQEKTLFSRISAATLKFTAAQVQQQALTQYLHWMNGAQQGRSSSPLVDKYAQQIQQINANISTSSTLILTLAQNGTQQQHALSQQQRQYQAGQELVRLMFRCANATGSSHSHTPLLSVHRPFLNNQLGQIDEIDNPFNGNPNINQNPPFHLGPNEHLELRIGGGRGAPRIQLGNQQLNDIPADHLLFRLMRQQGLLPPQLQNPLLMMDHDNSAVEGHHQQRNLIQQTTNANDAAAQTGFDFEDAFTQLFNQRSLLQNIGNQQMIQPQFNQFENPHQFQFGGDPYSYYQPNQPSQFRGGIFSGERGSYLDSLQQNRHRGYQPPQQLPQLNPNLSFNSSLFEQLAQTFNPQSVQRQEEAQWQAIQIQREEQELSQLQRQRDTLRQEISKRRNHQQQQQAQQPQQQQQFQAQLEQAQQNQPSNNENINGLNINRMRNIFENINNSLGALVQSTQGIQNNLNSDLQNQLIQSNNQPPQQQQNNLNQMDLFINSLNTQVQQLQQQVQSQQQQTNQNQIVVEQPPIQQAQPQTQLQPQAQQNIAQEQSQNVQMQQEQEQLQPQQQQQDQPSGAYDFESLGFPADFLQRNNIDPTFFEALNDDMRMELILQYLPKDTPSTQQQQQQQNQQQQQQQQQQEQQQLVEPSQTIIQQTGQDQNQNQNQNANANQSQSLAVVQQEVQQNVEQILPVLAEGQVQQEQPVVVLDPVVEITIPQLQPEQQQQQQNLVVEEVNQEFLDALPENIRQEILENQRLQRQINQAQQQNNSNNANNNNQNQQPTQQQQNAPTDMDNATFLATLTQDLREEVLLTSEPVFLESLPLEVQQEAQRLRDRLRPQHSRFDAGGMGAMGLGLGDMRFDLDNPNVIRHSNLTAQQQHHHNMVLDQQFNITHNQPLSTRRTLKEMVLMSSHERQMLIRLIKVDESFLQSLLCFLYTDNLTFTRFPFGVLKTIVTHPAIEYKIMNCLMFILKQPNLPTYQLQLSNQGQNLDNLTFPPLVLQERNCLIRDYSAVYNRVSLKIMYLFVKMTNTSVSFFLYQGAHLQKDKQKQNEIKPVQTIQESHQQRHHKSSHSQSQSTQQCLKVLKPYKKLIDKMASLPQQEDLFDLEYEGSPSQAQSQKETSQPSNLYDLVQLLNNKTIYDSMIHTHLLVNVLHNITKKAQQQLTEKQQLTENVCGICKFQLKDKCTACKAHGQYQIGECGTVQGECTHEFHKHCIQDLLKKYPGVCPLCNNNWEEKMHKSSQMNTQLQEQLKLDLKSIKSICHVLSSSVVDEPSMKKLSLIISVFCMEPSNLSIFVGQLKYIVFTMSKHMNASIASFLSFLRALTQSTANQQSQQNQIQEMMIIPLERHATQQTHTSQQNIDLTPNDLLVLNKLENEVHEDFKMQKILKIIRQLFERSYQISLQNKKDEQKAQQQKKHLLEQEEKKLQEQQVQQVQQVQQDQKMEIEGEQKLNDVQLQKESKLPIKLNSPNSPNNINNLSKEALEQARQEVRLQFQNLISDDALIDLWLNVTEVFVLLHQRFPKLLKLSNLAIQKLVPIIDSFFVIYKIMHDDESLKEGGDTANQNQQQQQFQQQQQQHLQRQNSTTQRQNSSNQNNQNQISKLESDINQPLPLVHENSFVSMQQHFGKLRTQGRNLDIHGLFDFMCEKNKPILNQMVKLNLGLLTDSLSMVLKNKPSVLDFENKRAFFKQELKRMKNDRGQYYGGARTIRLRIRRNDIFSDSYAQLNNLSPQELKGKIVIEFVGEEGMDAGGLIREWYLLLSKAIMNPNYALFKPSANNNTYQPSPQSYINNDHLRYFKFVGRIIGKALLDGYMLDAYFTRSFYKHILGQELSINDMEDIDNEYYQNLKWILENDIDAACLDQYYSYEDNEFGKTVTKDLIENGRNIPVTDNDKSRYVQLICYHKMAVTIEKQIKSFLEGFHELIPGSLVSIFNNRELELMISGLPDIDLENLKENTEYHGYTKETPVIKWLWDILDTLDKQEKANFIQFVTGTSKVPIGGFGELKGMNGLQKFQIQKSFDVKKLPTSHTCFNQLDLPEYPAKESLYEKLMIAIREGKDGFGVI